MMKWFGIISLVLLLHLAFFAILLKFTGRWPERELTSLLKALRTGESAKEPVEPSPETEEKEAKVGSSYEEYLAARTLQERELQRKQRELESLLRTIESGQASLKSRRTELDQLAEEIKKDAAQRQDKVVQQGREKVTELLEVMQPKIAKDFLFAINDDLVAIELIRKLEPVTAAKIFKEFKQPEEKRKLNGWLAKLGQGEPDASALRASKQKMTKGP